MAFNPDRLHTTEERLEIQLDDEAAVIVAEFYCFTDWEEISYPELDSIHSVIKEFVDTELSQYSVLRSGFMNLLGNIEDWMYERKIEDKE